MMRKIIIFITIVSLLFIPIISTQGKPETKILLLKDIPQIPVEGLEIVRKTGNGYLALYSGNKTISVPYSVLRTVRESAEGYHTYRTMTDKLMEYKTKYPELVKVLSIGKTIEGRDIWAIRIGKEQKKRILFIGCHHAREWMSVEIPLKIIDYLLTNYDTDEKVKNWVDSIEIWVIPMLNPDGHTYSVNVERMWRKNRRDNGDGTFGVDNNRNYGYKWGLKGSSSDTSSETYRGPYPFSELENQAIRDFTYEHPFNMVVSYHSFSELILYPWGYTKNPPPDEKIFEEIAKEMAKTTGPPNDNDYPGPYDYYPMQGSYLYPTSGDSDDWFYGNMGTLSFTIELNSSEEFFDPPAEKIEPTWQQTKGIAFTALNYTGINGFLRLQIRRENGEPYSGDVYIEEKKIKRNTQKDGLFMFFLMPGEYTINVKGVEKKVVIKEGEITEDTMIVPSRSNLSIDVYSEKNRIPLSFVAKLGEKEIESSNGHGIFENLEPDKYTLEIYSKGFYQYKGEIDLKEDTNIEIILKPKNLFVSKFDFPEFDILTDEIDFNDYQYFITDVFPNKRILNFVIFNKNPDYKTRAYFGIKNLKDSEGKIIGEEGLFKDSEFNVEDGSSFKSEEKVLFRFDEGGPVGVIKSKNIFFAFSPSSVEKKEEFLDLLKSYLYSKIAQIEIDHERYSNKDSAVVSVKFLRNSYIKIFDNFYFLKNGEGNIELKDLHEGRNVISVESFVNDRKLVSKKIEIVVDTIKPEVYIKDEYHINKKDNFFTFTVYEENLKDVIVNPGKLEKVISSGTLKTYYIRLSPKKDGKYFIKIIAEDMSGNRTEKISVIYFDSSPPKLEYISPEDGEKVHKKNIVITARISEVCFVKINGKSIKVIDNEFEFPVSLSTGSNLFELIIYDLSLNRSEYKINIIYEPQKIILKIGDKTAWISSRIYTLEYPPFIKNKRTFVPLRFIVEGLGGNVEWDGDERKVTVKFENIILVMWIGKREAILNGEKVIIDPQDKNIYPIILNGRTFIPLRFALESLGFKVEWNEVSKTITIYKEE